MIIPAVIPLSLLSFEGRILLWKQGVGLFHVQFLHVKHIRTCLKIRNELGPTLPVLAQVTVCVCSGKPGVQVLALFSSSALHIEAQEQRYFQVCLQEGLILPCRE